MNTRLRARIKAIKRQCNSLRGLGSLAVQLEYYKRIHSAHSKDMVWAIFIDWPNRPPGILPPKWKKAALKFITAIQIETNSPGGAMVDFDMGAFDPDLNYAEYVDNMLKQISAGRARP